MTINDILLLRDTLLEIKVGKLSSETFRHYLKFINISNTYFKEFDDKRKSFFEDAIRTLGYNNEQLTSEQSKEVQNLIIPLLDEYLFRDVDVNSHIFSWEELNDAILSNDKNSELPIDKKSFIALHMCTEEL